MAQALQNQTQISAYVSTGAKNKLDQISKARGLRKNFMFEQALLYYFRAVEELPAEAFLPARLVLSSDAFEQVLAQIDNPAPPTEAMMELMHGDSNTFVTTNG